MNKLKALIVTLVVGTSSVAMASPVSFSARGSVSISTARPVVTYPAREPVVVVRDHRTQPSYERPYVQYDRVRDRYNEQLYSLTGLYSSEHGPVRLYQTGDRITGTFVSGGGGTLQGRIVGGQIFFSWQNTNSQGHGVWMIQSGNRIVGTWGLQASETDGGAWTLTR